MLSLKNIVNFVYSEKHNSIEIHCIEIRPWVKINATYNWLKTMKIFKTVTPKSDGGRLQEVILFTRGSKYWTLTRKLWVFQIGDHYLQEPRDGCLTLVLSYMNFNCSLL